MESYVTNGTVYTAMIDQMVRNGHAVAPPVRTQLTDISAVYLKQHEVDYRRGIDQTTVHGNSPCAYIKANPIDNVVAVEWGTSIASLSASRIVGVVTQGDVYGIDNAYVVTQGDVYGIDNTYVATAALLQHLETDIIPRVLNKSKASDLFAYLNRESGQSLVYDNTISMGHDTLVRLLESGQSLVYDNTISMGHDTLVRLLVGSSTATARESDTALAYYVIDVRVILHWPTTS